MYSAQIARELGISRERVRQLAALQDIQLPNRYSAAMEKRAVINEAVNHPRLAELFRQYVQAEIDQAQFCEALSIPFECFFPLLRQSGLHLGSQKQLNVQRKKSEILHQRFGEWTVIGYLDSEDYLSGDLRDHKALCRCDCGTELPVVIHNLLHGRTLCCHQCAINRRRVIPWIRSDDKRFPTTNAAAADAGVTPAVFGIRIKDGRNVYKAANGFSYAALLDDSIPYCTGWKKR